MDQDYIGGVGLVSFLRAAWFASTLPIVVGWVPLPGIRWLHEVMLGFAKRGKILQSKTRLSVPQRTFTHFYGVGILWTTILLVAVWFYAVSLNERPDDHSSSAVVTREHVYNVWQSILMLMLMDAQVLRRFYESNFVFNYSPSARMHIVGYLVGISYYIAAPLSLCCNVAPEVFDFVKSTIIEGGFIINVVKGMEEMFIINPGEFDIWRRVMFLTHPLLSLEWYAWIGAAIFLWGSIHQFRCHVILGSLRKKTEKMEGGYHIPYGDWFEYTSSAHYTAEIVMYGGLLVASGGADLSLWLLFAFVVSNLGFAASITHRWYLQKFDDYPANRRAIFPYLY